MNIFYLDEDPQTAAIMHADKHVVKMILESAQLLSTAHRYLDGEQYIELSKNNRRLKRWRLHDERESILYKATHINHPCGVWVRENESNYAWLYSLFSFLADEYTYRYGKTHLTDTKLRIPLAFHPHNIPAGDITTPALAMPDYCKLDDPVESYRNYYLKEKSHILAWTKREKPHWLKK